LQQGAKKHVLDFTSERPFPALHIYLCPDEECWYARNAYGYLMWRYEAPPWLDHEQPLPYGWVWYDVGRIAVKLTHRDYVVLASEKRTETVPRDAWMLDSKRCVEKVL